MEHSGIITMDNTKQRQTYYAGFWRRLVASLLEFILIGIPIILIYRYAWKTSKYLFIFSCTVTPIFFILLDLYLFVRFGGDIGKLIVGIRVVKLNGEPIDIKNAILRNIVYILHSVAGIILFLIYMDKYDYIIMSSMDGKQLGDYFRRIYPPWNYIINTIYSIYDVSEAFVMLTNKKRRAIHDFIGGTIVIIHNDERCRNSLKKRRPTTG